MSASDLIAGRVAGAVSASAALLRGRLSRYSVPSPSVTDRFERELATAAGSTHALAVNSGTSALYCALAAVGVGPGDEVLIPAYTWISDAAAAVALGAVPVLVEVDESLTMDPEDMARRITPRTRAVVPVHMLNLVSDLDRIIEVARAHGIAVVEDACQSAGVRYHGRWTGTLGDAGALSFNQHKNLKAGEGGAVLTDIERIADRAKILHDAGAHVRAHHDDRTEPSFVGLNLRMSEVTSATLRPQLRRLDRQIAARRARRAAVVERLADLPGIRISRHNAPGEEVGLTVVFDVAEDAIAFADQPGVTRLLDTGRHVYTNWEPIVERRTFDPRFDPWAENPSDYSPDACPNTLGLLARSCSIALEPHLPLPLLRARAAAYRGPMTGQVSRFVRDAPVSPT